jgi:acetyl esterase/lipase
MKTILFALMLMTTATFAQEKAILLYPDGIPNSKPTPATYVETGDSESLSKISIPMLLPFFPKAGTVNGTAVIICPGGGYEHLAIGHEGTEIAAAFNKIGVTAFVLKYRLPSDSIMIDKTIGPLQDVQRAIQIVRENAAKWGIDANKVGIIGFRQEDI